MSKSNKLPYYTTKRIDETGAAYRVILGERSNGKTTGVLYTSVKNCWDTGTQLGYIRRWFDDIRGARGDQVFSNLVELGMIEEITGGEWTHVYREGTKWYFSRYDDQGERETAEDPFCFGFTLNSDEHDKGAGYPRIKTIIFDEMVARRAYLYDEFVVFMNQLSTIIRLKDDVVIYMIGNSISKYCPYFDEMRLSHVKDMKKGELELYQYGNSGLTVAVEFSDFPSKSKPSNKYFAFENPKLGMITGTGSVWELGIFPHAPCKFRPADIKFTYYIEYGGDIFQAEIVKVGNRCFTFIHPKTGAIMDEKALIFSNAWTGSVYHRQLINRPPDDIGRIIWSFFRDQRVCYSSNTVGDAITSYIEQCKKTTSA